MTDDTEVREDEERGRRAALRELAQTTMFSVVPIGNPDDVVRIGEPEDG